VDISYHLRFLQKPLVILSEATDLVFTPTYEVLRSLRSLRMTVGRLLQEANLTTIKMNFIRVGVFSHCQKPLDIFPQTLCPQGLQPVQKGVALNPGKKYLCIINMLSHFPSCCRRDSSDFVPPIYQGCIAGISPKGCCRVAGAAFDFRSHGGDVSSRDPEDAERFGGNRVWCSQT